MLLHTKYHLIKQVTNANYNYVTRFLFFFNWAKLSLMQLQHYIFIVAKPELRLRVKQKPGDLLLHT